MANHKSAAKRARQTIRKTERNRRYISAVRTAVKKLNLAIEEGKDKDTVAALLKATQSIVAKAAAKGLYHKNKAYRTIARLTKASANVEAGAAKTTKKATKKKKSTAKKKATKKKTTKKTSKKK